MILYPIQDNNTDFKSVILKTDSEKIKKTPHCSKHGAMNKVSTFEDGGYWRCCTTEATICRTGCISKST